MISFNDLSANEKAVLIWLNGEFVTSRTSPLVKCNLFSLSGIFIEVQFDLVEDNVKDIVVLGPHNIDPYIESINIPIFE